MTDVGSLFFVTTLAYLATNVDNVALLITLFAKFRDRGMFVFAGHLLAVLVVLVLAFAVGEAANLVGVRLLGYLGIVPLLLGVHWLYRTIRSGPAAQAEFDVVAGSRALGVTFLSLVGNSIDTFLTVTVLIADTRKQLDVVIAVAVVGLAILLGLAARSVVRAPALAPAIERIAAWLAPLVMIGVGVYVLADTATDVL